MKLYLNTADQVCIIKLDDQTYEWSAGHQLARDLLGFLHQKLQAQGKDWADLTEITCFTGPGSFTGLRIGAAVANTLANQLNIPLFDQNGQQRQIILPDYGRPANITAPKK